MTPSQLGTMGEGTPGSSDEDPFVVAVRDYIMATLSPLIPTGDQTGRFMYGLLRRALKTASRDDLEQVVLHCVAFTDGLRQQGFITEELAREAHTYLNNGVVSDAITAGENYDGSFDGSDTDDATAAYRLEVPGQSTPDWSDEEWEEHSSQETDSGLPEGHALGDAQGVATSQGAGAGHEATVEGDTNPNGAEYPTALQEDGTG